MIPRTEMDIAVVGCGVSLTLNNGVCKDAGVALGAVAPTVALVEACGQSADRHTAGACSDKTPPAQACSAACRPIDDKRGTIAYRTKFAGVLLKRTVAIAAERAGKA